MYDNEALLKNSKILLETVKDSILEKLNHKNCVNKKKLLECYPFFNNEMATFVTLNLNGSLRGCIGSLLPRRSLLEDLISNANAAAFSDPRFPPLNKGEFENIEIEISILTTPVVLDYANTVDLKRKINKEEDGVILKLGSNQATFLPQVWDQLPSFEEFFSHLCQKAGLGMNCLDRHPDIFIYKALKIK